MVRSPGIGHRGIRVTGLRPATLGACSRIEAGRYRAVTRSIPEDKAATLRNDTFDMLVGAFVD